MIKIKKQKWDTEILGIGTASIEDISAKEEALREFLRGLNRWMKTNKVCFVFTKTDNEKVALQLKEKGFKEIETNIIYKHEPRSVGCLKSEVGVVRDVNKNNTEEIETLGKIAYESFVYSRYLTDSEIDEDKARELKRQWIINDCKGRADKVFIAEDNGKIEGFVACMKKKDEKEKNYALLDLIAVAKNSRGKGIGTQLVNVFLNYAKEIKTEYALVGTQDKNKAACRLYEKAGFKEFKRIKTFHYHIKKFI